MGGLAPRAQALCPSGPSGSPTGHNFTLSPGGRWPQLCHQLSSGNRNPEANLYHHHTHPNLKPSPPLQSGSGPLYSQPLIWRLREAALPSYLTAAPGDVVGVTALALFSLVTPECPQPQPQAKWAGREGQEQ